MKKFLLNILIFFAKIAYWFLRHIIPQCDTVVFLSRQSDEPSVDFRLLQAELERQAPYLKQKTYCRRLSGDGAGNLQDFLALIPTTLALLRARGCFVDGQCIPLSLFTQRKNFVAVQIWHSLGALKKFGWQTVGTDDGHTEVDAHRWKMHRHYDFITCTAPATQGHYSSAFGYPPEKVLTLGMPRVDHLMSLVDNPQAAERIYEKHPGWREKFKLLYVPTFRKNRPLDLSPILEVLTPEKREKYKLIVKVHPNDIPPDTAEDVAITSISTFEMFAVSDAIITDYSAAAIEASPFGKPLYFYVPDLEEYTQKTGLNIRLDEEMPHATFGDFAQLLDAIENAPYDFDSLARFREKYLTMADTENSRRIVEVFLERLGT
ncbi:MAG: CDP-glycerol glycerophosphotransferase family protein [Oscillospiraceae bacterium]|nr:CDP-glycerol glycerophosphotransferase family protein [Oscillospiraceae bacterium]